MNRSWKWLPLAWWKDNIDYVAVIAVVATMSILGTVNVIEPEKVTEALPAILGVMAFTMLRDRSRSHLGDRQLESVSGVVQRIDRKIDTLSSLRVLSGADIGNTLDEAHRDTDIWVFRGGTGTYTRTVTLPNCIRNARPVRRLLQIRLEILDPTDLAVCEEYATLYRKLATGPEDDAAKWTGDGTRRESYATVLAACFYKQQYLPLKIEIGLSSEISTFRYDMSAKYLIITQRGPQFEALLLDRNQSHYDYWRFELDMSFDRCRKLEISSAMSKTTLSDLPDVDEVRRLFRELNADFPSEYTDEDVREIIKKAVEPGNSTPIRGVGDIVTQRINH